MPDVIEHAGLAGVFTRAAGPSIASTWNPNERTVQVVMSTGAAVARRSWAEGPYIEELEISREAVDLSRADGMSFLDSHASYSIADRLGTLVAGSVRIEGGNLVGTVRLSRNEAGEVIARDLDDGHPFSVSVGYRIDAFEWIDATGENPARLRATKWTPYELSIVAIPADPGSRTRFQPLHEEESTMPQGNNHAAPAARTDPATAERERQSMIRHLARSAGMDANVLDRALDEGTSVEAFRIAAFDAMATRQEAAGIFPISNMQRESTEARTAETVRELTDVLAGRSARGGVEVARQFLEASGVRTGAMGDRDIGRALFGGNSHWSGGARAMHTSGDFAFLVANAAHAVLLERFTASASVLKRFSRQRNAADFRPTSFYRSGEAPDLLKVNEHGEIKHGTLSEEKNAFRVDTYARIFALSFQASVNDGLNAFGDFLTAFAESATNLESALFFNLLDGFGPKLDDGFALFHENHGNLAAAGAAPSIDTVAEGVLAMRTQRNLSGNGTAGVAPAVLLVGPALETRARQLVATIAATERESVNPWSNLEVVVEDRFGRDFAGWYLLASPTTRPTFIHGSLEGHSTPNVDEREGWEVLGREYRVVHHFGAGIADYRAVYFNPGQ